jgi:hypothetical protein
MAPRFPPEFGARRCKAPSRGEEGRGPAGFALGSGPRQRRAIECLVGLEFKPAIRACRDDKGASLSVHLCNRVPPHNHTAL